MDHILFNTHFCQNILHVFYLDLLRLISRKERLIMLVIKVNLKNQQVKDCLRSLCRVSSDSAMLKIAKF